MTTETTATLMDYDTAEAIRPATATPRLLYDIPSALVELGGMSRSVFYELVKDGQIRTLKIGRRTYVAHDELKRYVSSLTERETAESIPQSKLA